MQWDKMTKRQQTEARGLLDKLSAQGVTQALPEIAAHFEAAAAWGRGEGSLHALCRHTGWNLPADAGPEPGQQLHAAIQEALDTTTRPALGTVERVHHIAAELATVKKAGDMFMNELEKALVAADRGEESDSRESLARAASAGLSRRLVLGLLGAEDVLSTARDVVRKANPQDQYGISLKSRKGVVYMYFDDPEKRLPDALHSHPDDPGLEPAGYPPRDTITEHAFLDDLLRDLRQAGLDVTSDGPGASIEEDLCEHLPVTIRIAKAR